MSDRYSSGSIEDEDMLAVSYTNVEVTYTITDHNDVETEYSATYELCAPYWLDYWLIYIIPSCISGFVVVVNSILKAYIITLILWVGEHTCSEQLSSITNVVFLAQFVNTAFVLLLVNGNMSEH